MEKFVFSGTSVSQVLPANAQLWGHPLLYGENTCARQDRAPVTQPGGDMEETRDQDSPNPWRNAVADPRQHWGPCGSTRDQHPTLPPIPGSNVP